MPPVQSVPLPRSCAGLPAVTSSAVRFTGRRMSHVGTFRPIRSRAGHVSTEESQDRRQEMESRQRRKKYNDAVFAHQKGSRIGSLGKSGISLAAVRSAGIALPSITRA